MSDGSDGVYFKVWLSQTCAELSLCRIQFDIMSPQKQAQDVHTVFKARVEGGCIYWSFERVFTWQLSDVAQHKAPSQCLLLSEVWACSRKDRMALYSSTGKHPLWARKGGKIQTKKAWRKSLWDVRSQSSKETLAKDKSVSRKLNHEPAGLIFTLVLDLEATSWSLEPEVGFYNPANLLGLEHDSLCPGWPITS